MLFVKFRPLLCRTQEKTHSRFRLYRQQCALAQENVDSYHFFLPSSMITLFYLYFSIYGMEWVSLTYIMLLYTKHYS